MPTRLSLFGYKIQDTPAERRKVLGVSIGLLAGLTAVEWQVHFDVSLGILYTVPVAVGAVMLSRTQVVAYALICAVVRGQFTPHLSDLESFFRFLMAWLAYSAAGLLVVEMSNSRRRIVDHFARLQLEQQLRQKAEQQLRILVESSPAAILTLDAEARVAAANRAAHDMFGYPSGSLTGESIAPYFPVFQHALAYSPGGRPVRSSVSGWARRKEGQMFPVQAWFSTYGTGEDHALAAILVDMSEDVRERELDNFRHLVDHHRLLAGAVSHEIRNLCSAISVVCANLANNREIARNADFEALQSLVRGLTRIASVELRRTGATLAPVDIPSVLDQLLVVVDPDWSDIDGEIVLDVESELPQVLADAHGLLQIFLNLSQNSCRALAASETRRLEIHAAAVDDSVQIRFQDSGPGVQDASVLFQPFRAEADGSGLGLYVSRELARSFGGDLLYVPTTSGARFDVILRTGSPRP